VSYLNPPHEDISRDSTPTLIRASREHDRYIGDSHRSPSPPNPTKAFSIFREPNTEPDLSALLCYTTDGDKRLVPSEAKQLEAPTILQCDIKESMERNLIQRRATIWCVFCVMQPLFEPLIIIEEILLPWVRAILRALLLGLVMTARL
jgi:hypothetical protein